MNSSLSVIEPASLNLKAALHSCLLFLFPLFSLLVHTTRAFVRYFFKYAFLFSSPPSPGDQSQTFLNTHSPCWALLWLFHGGRVSEYQPPFLSRTKWFHAVWFPFEFIKHHIYIILYPFFFQSWQKFLRKRFASDSNRTGPRGQRFRLEEGLWNRSVNELSKDAAQHSKGPLFLSSVPHPAGVF